MKILYVITGLGLGGAEKVVVDLADEMVLKGHFVKIIYLKGNVTVAPKSKNIKLIGLNFNQPFDFFKALLGFKRIIKSFKPDIVHSHMIHANVFSRICRIVCQIPRLICSAHNSNEGGKLRMLSYKYTNWLSDINTNVSLEASDKLIKTGAFNTKNLITIYNGINLNKFDFVPKKVVDVKTFLSIGRLQDQKDYPNLLEAIFLVKRKNKSVKFYIAGEGELRETLEKLIKNLDISNMVQLLGQRSDIPDLLTHSDFFILPSKHEGLPTVVIESMARGTYVIATDCGGVKEIICDTGMLVPKQNSKALAEAILNALDLDEKQIAQNNLKARKIVENKFSLSSSVLEWQSLYEQ